MAVRRPKFKYQIGDPTTWLDSHICTLECGAMGLDIISGGRIDVWGGNLVPYCGRSTALIVQRGTNLSNVAQAWKHWGKTLENRTGYTWANVLSDIRAGYWVILQGDYDQFSLSVRCQDSFLGDHAILVGPESTSNEEYLSADPLCRDFKYIPADQLRNYSQKLARRIYTNAGRRWYGQLFYARIKPAVVSAHYKATVTNQTQLWNETTDQWVYKLTVGTVLIVRPKQFTKNGVACYAVSGPKPYHTGEYYVPVKNVKLGAPV